MSTTFMGPARAAAIRFLVLLGLCIAWAAGRKLGFIDPATTQRMLGALIGLMVATVGNAVPKLRPLSSAGTASRSVMSTERFAGWVLVAAGLAQGVLFLSAPLSMAPIASGSIAGAALIAIALRWVVFALRTRANPDRPVNAAAAEGVARDAGDHGSAEASPQAQARARFKLWLFVGFFYVLLTSITAVLFNEKAWAKSFASWMLVGYALLCAALFAYLERKRPRKQ